MVPRWLVQFLHPPQKFERSPFLNGESYRTIDYGVEVPFNSMTFLLNLINVYDFFSNADRVVQTHRQDNDLINLLFFFVK
jgi:hypothetical protein